MMASSSTRRMRGTFKVEEARPVGEVPVLFVATIPARATAAPT